MVLVSMNRPFISTPVHQLHLLSTNKLDISKVSTRSTIYDHRVYKHALLNTIVCLYAELCIVKKFALLKDVWLKVVSS